MEFVIVDHDEVYGFPVRRLVGSSMCGHNPHEFECIGTKIVAGTVDYTVRCVFCSSVEHVSDRI